MNRISEVIVVIKDLFTHPLAFIKGGSEHPKLFVTPSSMLPAHGVNCPVLIYKYNIIPICLVVATVATKSVYLIIQMLGSTYF